MPKSLTRGPQEEEASRWPQDAHKRGLRGPKMPPRGPKMTTKGFKIFIIMVVITTMMIIIKRLFSL